MYFAYFVKTLLHYIDDFSAVMASPKQGLNVTINSFNTNQAQCMSMYMFVYIVQYIIWPDICMQCAYPPSTSNYLASGGDSPMSFLTQNTYSVPSGSQSEKVTTPQQLITAVGDSSNTSLSLSHSFSSSPDTSQDKAIIHSTSPQVAIIIYNSYFMLLEMYVSPTIYLYMKSDNIKRIILRWTIDFGKRDIVKLWGLHDMRIY